MIDDADGATCEVRIDGRATVAGEWLNRRGTAAREWLRGSLPPAAFCAMGFVCSSTLPPFGMGAVFGRFAMLPASSVFTGSERFAAIHPIEA